MPPLFELVPSKIPLYGTNAGSPSGDVWFLTICLTVMTYIKVFPLLSFKFSNLLYLIPTPYLNIKFTGFLFGSHSYPGFGNQEQSGTPGREY
jgi:hypothetical protein